MDFYLEKNDPLRRADKLNAKQSLEKSTAPDESQNMSNNGHAQTPNSNRSAKLPTQTTPLMLPVKDKVPTKTTTSIHTSQKHSRYIPQGVKLIAAQKSQGQCEFINQKTGKRCDCRFRLQYEHKTPWAMNGNNSLANIEILCPTHNALRAREKYGNHFIEKKIEEKKL